MKIKTSFWLMLILLSLSGCSNLSSISLESQEKCAAQARKVFDTDFKAMPGSEYRYQNHYNNKTNKCYILVRGTGTNGIDYELRDAYENGTTIAICSSETQNVNSQTDITSAFCRYNKSPFEKMDIKKFDNFAEQYMQE